MTLISSPAHLDYGLDTLFGRITKSAECRVGLEQVMNDPTCFAIRVSARRCRKISSGPGLSCSGSKDAACRAPSDTPNASTMTA